MKYDDKDYYVLKDADIFNESNEIENVRQSEIEDFKKKNIIKSKSDNNRWPTVSDDKNNWDLDFEQAFQLGQGVYTNKNKKKIDWKDILYTKKEKPQKIIVKTNNDLIVATFDHDELLLSDDSETNEINKVINKSNIVSSYEEVVYKNFIKPTETINMKINDDFSLSSCFNELKKIMPDSNIFTQKDSMDKNLLTYQNIDEDGKIVNPKEMFNKMCYVFHGQRSKKKELEKTKKKKKITKKN